MVTSLPRPDGRLSITVENKIKKLLYDFSLQNGILSSV